MKPILFTFIICFTLGASFSQGLRFDRSTHQFGQIQETGGKVYTTFTFTNTSDTIIQIEATFVTCGCTIPKVSQKPLQSGEQGILEVQYDPNGRPGKFRKKIRLLAKGLKTKAEVFIEGEVIPHPYPIITGDLRWKANLFNFGKLWHHQTDTLWLPVINTGKIPITFLINQAKLPKGLYWLTPNNTLYPAQYDSLGLVWNVPHSKDWGFAFKTLHLPLQLANGKIDSVRLQTTANIQEDFTKAKALGKQAKAKMVTDSLNLGEIFIGKAQAKGSFHLVNIGNEVLHIRQIKTSCPCLKVMPKSSLLVPGSSTRLQVNYTPDKNQFGKQQFIVLLTVNDLQQPQRRLVVRVEVKKKTK